MRLLRIRRERACCISHPAHPGIGILAPPSQDCFLSAWRKGGVRGLYAGCFASMLEIAPYSAIVFTSYEGGRSQKLARHHFIMHFPWLLSRHQAAFDACGQHWRFTIRAADSGRSYFLIQPIPHWPHWMYLRICESLRAASRALAEY